MDNQIANAFTSTWAVVELFGHQKEVGFVSVQSFGPAQMFRIDVPPRPEREYTLECPEYVGGDYQPVGTIVKRMEREGKSRLIGVGAIYAINPCTEQMAMAALERLDPPKLKLVSLAKQLPAPGEIEPMVDLPAMPYVVEDNDGELDMDGGELNEEHF